MAEAGHATDPVRKATRTRQDADHGTAGIVGVLAQEGRSRSIIAVGNQTSNTNTDPEHPIKRLIARELAASPHAGYLSVHGMGFGRVLSPLDSRELDAVIGLGMEPDEEAIAAAERLQRLAAEYGLHVVIGNKYWHVEMAKTEAGPRDFPGVTTDLKLDENGKPATARLAAYGDAFTTTYASRLEVGRAPINMQLEISRRLRLQPEGDYVRPDRDAEVMAVYLGYRLTELATEICVERANLSTQ